MDHNNQSYYTSQPGNEPQKPTSSTTLRQVLDHNNQSYYSSQTGIGPQRPVSLLNPAPGNKPKQVLLLLPASNKPQSYYSFNQTGICQVLSHKTRQSY